MEVPDPVGWDAARGPWHQLVDRMVMRWEEFGSFNVVLDGVVPEPVLAGFEARDDRMTRLARV
jgi:hypothetical protein